MCKEHRFTQQELKGSDIQPPTCCDHKSQNRLEETPKDNLVQALMGKRAQTRLRSTSNTSLEKLGSWFFSSYSVIFLSYIKMMGLPCQQRRSFPLARIYYWQSKQYEGLSNFSAAFSYHPFQGCGARSTQVQMSKAILRRSSLVAGSSSCQR